MANSASTTVLKFSNGVGIPQLGFGVSRISAGEVTQRAVRWALEVGPEQSGNPATCPWRPV